jgi:uncharacterized RDD family membrane protein YckC
VEFGWSRVLSNPRSTVGAAVHTGSYGRGMYEQGRYEHGMVPEQQPYGGYWARQPYGGFWRRVIAYVIDGIILGVVLGAIESVLVTLSRGNGVDVGRSAGWSLVVIVVAWLYYALMESSSLQATVGKLALSMRVTDLEGRRISFGRATGRFFAKILNVLTLGIGYLLAAFTPRKRALHDYVAGTLVYKSWALRAAAEAQPSTPTT